MDPSFLANLVVQSLSPLVAKGVEEVAKSAFKDAYTAIKTRLGKDPEAKKALDKFEESPAEGGPALQAALEQHLVSDAKLLDLLARDFSAMRGETSGPRVENLKANKVVIAQDIDTVNMGE